MSDRGIPYSYRHMHGFGSHTFSLINAKNERIWVKFHLTTHQGIKNLTDQEAEAVIGKCAGKAISATSTTASNAATSPVDDEDSNFMTEEQAQKSPFNPFDLTKVWPHKENRLSM